MLRSTVVRRELVQDVLRRFGRDHLAVCRLDGSPVRVRSNIFCQDTLVVYQRVPVKFTGTFDYSSVPTKIHYAYVRFVKPDISYSVLNFNNIVSARGVGRFKNYLIACVVEGILVDFDFVYMLRILNRPCVIYIVIRKSVLRYFL